MLRVGEQAPDFEGTDCRGAPVRLSQFRGKKVVLFFFPKVFTPGCTLENRHFRDNHARIRQLGAELIGVSVDTMAQACAFATEERLDFHLMADESRDISEQYGVVWPLLNRDRRATFVIDETGKVAEVIHHEVRVSRHLDDVLKFLETGPTA
jgi:thioredoxin-dependent peroxiredoxin